MDCAAVAAGIQSSPDRLDAYLDGVFVPEADLAHVADAHQRLLSVVDRLTDADVGKPSLLPGWTVGHVLSHVARNADSHVRRAEAAVRGEVIDQYAGGRVGREAEIDVGARRPAAELAADVRASAAAAEAAWAELPPAAWVARSRDANARERPLFELPGRRWQEVEVHVIDLDAGVTYRDWPEAFVLEWLPRTRERVWREVADGTFEFAGLHDPRVELAWLYGRLSGPDFPSLPSWG
jgi:maleylpyruvate isomerase